MRTDKWIMAFAAVVGGCLAAHVGGCMPSVAKDAVRADVAAEANVASPQANLAAKAEFTGGPTSQPVTGTQGDTQAGRDAKPIQIIVTASGSAWPLVATACIVLALVLSVIYLRSRQDGRDKLRKAKDWAEREAKRTGVVTGNALGVAKAIKNLPAGSDRDALLTTIAGELRDKAAWDELLDSFGLRVHRRTDAKT